MQSTTLTHTIGNNFGRLMSQIALEHLQDNNVEKCLGIFNSLLGPDGKPMPFEYVKDIMLDKTVLVVKDNEMFIDSKSNQSNYTDFNLRELFIKKAKILDDSIKELYKLTNYIRYNKSYSINLYIPVQEIYQYAFTNDSNILTSRFLDAIEYDHNDINILITIVKELKHFFNITKPNITNTLIWIYNNFGEELKDKSKYNRYIDEMKPDLSNIFDKQDSLLLSIKYKNLLDYIATNLDEDDIECNYDSLDDEDKEEIFDLIYEIHNVKDQFNNYSHSNPTSAFDAAWLSTEGLLYTANGPVSMMLHMRIADEIYNLGLIPSEFKDNPEHYLEDEGWIKIHYNEVYYTGYYHNKKITSSQFKTLRIICDKLNGLQLGYKRNFITPEVFKQLDDNQLANLLRF